jgi:hypothetical protein
MSLPTSNADFGALAPRAPGQLITSADWNALVAASRTVQDSVNAISQAAETRLAALETGVVQIQANLQTAVAQLTALAGVVAQYNRVTLKPSQAVYAIGETGVILATVTDLSGNPIAFTETNRPWVTFVCTWGRLRAVAGFDSDAGAGDRTVAVRTNLQGVAQVRLQPDHAESFDIGMEDDVATTMTGKIAAANMSAADIIRTSATPVTANDAGAFKFLATEYDRTDTSHMRDYVDTYYQKYPARVSGKGIVSVPQTWHDYRATVICFVQNSNDVTAPDFGRSSGAVEVVFRDWIGPWYNIYYGADTSTAQGIRDRLTPKVTGDLAASVTNLKSEVAAIVSNPGVIRKLRDYRLVRDALGQINPPQPPTFLNAVAQSFQNAISIQQTLQSVQDKTLELPQQDVAFEVFTDAATRADTSVAAANTAVAAVQQQLTAVQQSVTDATGKVATLTNNLTAVGTRLDSALADTGAVGTLRLQLSAVKTQVGAFSALNPSDITTKLAAVSDLSTRVLTLETKK